MKLQKHLAALVGATILTGASQAIAQQLPLNAPHQSSPVAPQNSTAVAQSSPRPVLRTMPLPAERLQDIPTALGIKYAHDPRITVTADEVHGQLIIMAPENVHAQIQAEAQQMLASGLVQRAAGVVSVAPASRQFPLIRITWREFEDELVALAGGRAPMTTRRNGELATFELADQRIGTATVEVDRRRNAVTVVAPEPMLDGWQTLVTTLDGEDAAPGKVMRLVKLQNAEPAPVQKAMRLLRELKPRNVDGTTVGVAGRDTRFMTTAVAQQDLQEGALLDPQQQPDDQVTGVLPQNGLQDPTQAVAGDAESGLFGDVQIQFVPQLGVIIVRGAKRDVERVMQVIDEIERQAVQTQPRVEVYQLQHADSEAIADLVTELYSGALAARGANLSITALVKPNALLLVGREEAIVEAMDLIARLDTDVDATTQFRVFRLAHASAVDAETSLRTFFTAQPGEDEDPRPGLGTRVRLIADFRTNSLIVQAAPRDMAEVARLIADLDVVKVPAQSELRVFQLRNALAEELQPVLQEAISGQAAGAAAPEGFTPPSTTLSIVAVDSDQNRVITSGLLAGVVVSADANANALVVRAPGSSMELIAELIRQLDRLPGAESVVKVFQLQHSDAGALSQALANLFSSQTQTGGGFGGFGGFGGAVGAAGAGVNLAPATASAEGSLVPLRFSVDPRTNSVIAVGSISDLEVVESIVLRLDTEGFATRITEVVWLRNANAADVAIAINDYVTLRNQSYTQLIQTAQAQGGSAISVYDFPDRDLIVVPEPTTNSLLVSASPRMYETVMRVIDQLDRRPPMVMVRVILAEVSLSDGFEWGSEFGIQDSLLFDRGVAGTASNPGFNFNGAGLPNANQVGADDLAGQTLSTFGLGRASQQFGYGGFVLAAASDSVSLLLRSLQDAQRLQVLSRPMIMTKDNNAAEIQVGQTVRLVTGIINNGIAGTQVVVEPEEVGLLLTVLPRVGSDGLIRMEIDTERSNVSLTDGVPIGTDNNGNPIISPIINRTRASSVVTAFSGQTVVFGGLIQKSRAATSRRIPYLSNIPVLGALFRYDIETESRDELLIIMTPIIVSSDEDLEYIKQEESGRMSWCLADVVEMHGDVGLSGGYGLWGPAVGPMIYPDVTPTIDDIEMMHGELLMPPMQDGMPVDPNCPPGTVIDGEVPLDIQPTPYADELGMPGMPSVVEPAYPIIPGSPAAPHAGDRGFPGPQSLPSGPQGPGAAYPPGTYPPAGIPSGAYPSGRVPGGAPTAEPPGQGYPVTPAAPIDRGTGIQGAGQRATQAQTVPPQSQVRQAQHSEPSPVPRRLPAPRR